MILGRLDLTFQRGGTAGRVLSLEVSPACEVFNILILEYSMFSKYQIDFKMLD